MRARLLVHACETTVTPAHDEPLEEQAARAQTNSGYARNGTLLPQVYRAAAPPFASKNSHSMVFPRYYQHQGAHPLRLVCGLEPAGAVCHIASTAHLRPLASQLEGRTRIKSTLKVGGVRAGAMIRRHVNIPRSRRRAAAKASGRPRLRTARFRATVSDPSREINLTSLTGWLRGLAR